MKARHHPCSHIDCKSKPRTTYRKPFLLVDHDDVHWRVIDLQYISRSRKFQEGLKLWMRVFALLSPRDAEWIENASELWPPVLRRRLNSALDQHERSRSLASPFRSTFFRPGFKYINSFEFRDLSAVNEVEQQISGI